MARKISFAADEFYHLYNRGTDKRIIFNNDDDRNRFVKLLYLSNGSGSFHFSDISKYDAYSYRRGTPLVDITSYCLMPNHFHILVREIDGEGASKFMHKLATSYTMYFNKINSRKGRLFETNFQAIHIDSDEFLAYVHSYIHLNPIKIYKSDWKTDGIGDLTKAKKFLWSYKHSSLPDYRGIERTEKAILNRNCFPHFETKKEVDDYLEDWLTYQDINKTHEAKPRG